MMTSRSDRPLIIWRITDGKPGHEKQTLGLAHALLRNRLGECFDLAAPARNTALLQWIQGRFLAGNGLPAPDIILAAGHNTHFALLAARRAYGGKFGGKTVVLMKPSLPLSWFDLCLIPEHDSPPGRENVIPTLGVLNNLTDWKLHETIRGLILIGGPSPHFHWNSDAIRRQIKQRAEESPEMKWIVTTSRRTPAGFLDELGDVAGIECRPVEQTPPGWLEEQMNQASAAWCTPDSVSMVYEALTAGCQVGLLNLAAIAGSRVASGVSKLAAMGYVTTFAQRPITDRRLPPPPPLDEAGRCAKLIIQRWFP
jgi:mitochondrial fission protein ELM1